MMIEYAAICCQASPVDYQREVQRRFGMLDDAKDTEKAQDLPRFKLLKRCYKSPAVEIVLVYDNLMQKFRVETSYTARGNSTIQRKSFSSRTDAEEYADRIANANHRLDHAW